MSEVKVLCFPLCCKAAIARSEGGKSWLCTGWFFLPTLFFIFLCDKNHPRFYSPSLYIISLFSLIFQQYLICISLIIKFVHSFTSIIAICNSSVNTNSQSFFLGIFFSPCGFIRALCILRIICAYIHIYRCMWEIFFLACHSFSVNHFHFFGHFHFFSESFYHIVRVINIEFSIQRCGLLNLPLLGHTFWGAFSIVIMDLYLCI